MIGDNIRLYRKEKGWSQDKLAKKSGLSKISIGNYERGVRCPTLDTLQKIADVLNVPLSALTNDSRFSYTPDSESKLKSYLLSKGYDFNGIPLEEDYDDAACYVREWGSVQFFSYIDVGQRVYRAVSCEEIKSTFNSIEKFIEFTMDQLIKKSSTPPETLE